MLKKVTKIETKTEKPKKENSKREYKQLVEPRELELNETTKLVFSVSSIGEDGRPHLDIRTWIKSEAYEGPTKKGINFDTEMLYDFIEIIDQLNKECEEKGY